MTGLTRHLAPFAPLREINNLFESFAFDHSNLFRVSGFEFRVYSDLALIFSATSR